MASISEGQDLWEVYYLDASGEIVDMDGVDSEDEALDLVAAVVEDSSGWDVPIVAARVNLVPGGDIEGDRVEVLFGTLAVLARMGLHG